MPTYYCDSSAILKLVVPEPHSAPLRLFVDGARLVSSQLALAEVPRACHRIAATSRSVDLNQLLGRANRQLGSLVLLPLDAELVSTAGALGEPNLRSLDAIHVVTAIQVGPLDGFLSYDRRQAAVAQLAGLPTFSPGV